MPVVGTPARLSTQTLLLATLPAVIVGLLIRAWVMRSPLLALNSDEAITGLQAFEVLHGRFRLVVAGNDYGATTETYLIAPLLTFWTGVWPLRVMSALLSVVAAYALYRLALPIYDGVTATALSLIGWTTSGAIVLLWSRPYMGYATGFIAQVTALALACHAMRTSKHLARTALWAGIASGLAIWSHPMFGAVALLALITPSVLRWRQLVHWWLSLAAGGLLGVCPWLLYVAIHGEPRAAFATVRATYSERLRDFFIELLPRGFGLRAPDGSWLSPPGLAATAAAVLIIAALGGLVLLTVRKGAQAVPILVAGLLTFPCLALFAPLAFSADGRYSLPFLPQLLMGIGAWSLLLPDHVRNSPWLVVSIPTIWALAFCVPILHHQSDWQLVDPDRDAKQVVTELDSRDITYLAGDYWETYLVDYLADNSLTVSADLSVRLAEEAQQVRVADPHQVAYIYTNGTNPSLALPKDQYELLKIGNYDLYLPVKAFG